MVDFREEMGWKFGLGKSQNKIQHAKSHDSSIWIIWASEASFELHHSLFVWAKSPNNVLSICKPIIRAKASLA